MTLKNKRILIAGGTGFIGRFVVSSLLEQGAEVFCLTRQALVSQKPKLTYIQCDLNSISPGLNRAIGAVDCLIYMAASIPVSTQKKESFFEAIRTTFNPLVNFLEEFGGLAGKIVYTSTIDIHGPTPPQGYINEDTPPAPVTPYAVAKLCAEDFLKPYCKSENKVCVILRFSQVYGPCEPKVRVMPFIIDAAANQKEFTLIGTGEEKRKFLYVADAAAAVAQAVSLEKSDTFVIPGREETSVRQVISAVERLTRRKIQIKQSQSERAGFSILPDGAKANQIFGFEAKTSLEEGLKASLDKANEYQP